LAQQKASLHTWPLSTQKMSAETRYLEVPATETIFTSTVGSEPSIVNTTCPEPLTVPFLKAAAFFVTVNVLPEVFPPMVNVIVVAPMLEVCVQLNSLLGVQIVNTEMVVLADASLFVTSSAVTAVMRPSVI